MTGCTERAVATTGVYTLVVLVTVCAVGTSDTALAVFLNTVYVIGRRADYKCDNDSYDNIYRLHTLTCAFLSALTSISLFTSLLFFRITAVKIATAPRTIAQPRMGIHT